MTRVIVNLTTGSVVSIGDTEAVPGTIALHVDGKVRPGDDVSQVKELFDAIATERAAVKKMRAEALLEIGRARRDAEKKLKQWQDRLELWESRLSRKELNL